MRVGYVPDCFGHISQFPQIMRGFGIDNAVLFRGITTDQVKAEFTWRSPDGSEVLCVKMPDNNAYSNFLYRLRPTLSAAGEIDFEQSRKEIQALVEDCEREKPTTSNLLFMDGVDHIFPNPKTPAIMSDANENMDFGTIFHSTLPAFVEAVRSENPELETVEGELRWSNRAWNLQSVLAHVMSSRIHLKQANHEIQTLLEKWAEPFSTIAWTLGKSYPSSYLSLAWKYLLQNHPHDSICGCSPDQVHRDMVYRFDQARLITQPIVDQSLSFIADKVDTSTAPEKSVAVVVFNPLSWERTEVVDADIFLPHDFDEWRLQITDVDGNEVPFRVLGGSQPWGLIQQPYDIPVGLPYKGARVVFLAENVPSVGYKTFYARVLDTPYRTPGTLVTGPNSAENDDLVLTVEADGTLTIIDKNTAQLYSGGMIFEDGGDFGDGYNYVKPVRDAVVTSLGSIAHTSVVEDNSVRVRFKIETILPVPASKNPNNQERSAAKADLAITSYVTLAKGSRRVEITTQVENNACDHRLRVLFPSGINAEYSNAEGAFDVLTRAIAIPECKDWREPMPATQPQKSFVDVSDGELGILLINEGLPEYEVKNDAERTIALTLMRCTGNGVGGSDAQVEGQLLGKHQFRYAVAPHSDAWQDAMVWRDAWSHNAPFRIATTAVHEGTLPLSKSFLSIESPEVVLSILKKSDRTDDITARFFNFKDAPVSGDVSIESAGAIRRTDMNEETIDENPVGTLNIGPKQIVTLAAELQKG
jgi:alpha-mannosidase